MSNRDISVPRENDSTSVYRFQCSRRKLPITMIVTVKRIHKFRREICGIRNRESFLLFWRPARFVFTSPGSIYANQRHEQKQLYRGGEQIESSFHGRCNLIIMMNL